MLRPAVVWHAGAMASRAGTVAQPQDLVDLTALLDAYYDVSPDLADPGQRVAFGTSGHRGSSLKASFNEPISLAITQAIVEYRAGQGITGPLYLAQGHPCAERTGAELRAGGAGRQRRERADRRPPRLHPHPGAEPRHPDAQQQPPRPARRRRTASWSRPATTRPATAASSTTRRTAARRTRTPPAGSPTAPTSCWRTACAASSGSRWPTP